MSEEAPADVEDLAVDATTPGARERLLLIAASEGNFATAMTPEALTRLGVKAVEAYERDKSDRKDWEGVVKEMLELASQDRGQEQKMWPWDGASNVNVPLLTVGALQFNARMYPAVVKGDEAILCKVIGQDNGVPVRAPNPAHGQIQPVPQIGPDGQPATDPATGQLVPEWQVPPGGKAKRARRVSEYLNTTIFYRMDDWEADTDALLTQLPIAGCAFRKVWFDRDLGARSAMVPALHLVVPQKTKSLETAPRITEEIHDVFPHEIDCRRQEGYYLDVDLGIAEDDFDKPRLLLEQHCWLDLDDDGYKEPYIVTLDKEQRQVLRVEPNFSADDIKWSHDGRPVRITKGQFYVKYGFFPHPEGKFYDIGLGHLLKKVSAVIDTSLNQLVDAGNAQTAGGGFIASGLRLQGRAGRSVVKFRPGEYKTVEMAGDDIRRSIIERTAPTVSPVTFQVLEFVLGFAKEIGGFKDILTGDTAATAPVGTTMALIEQGLQVFNAIAKRFFRDARKEYQLLFDKVRRYGAESLAEDYLKVLDDPEADFATDFTDTDMDIRPVSDPSMVTRMQKMAKAEYLKSNIGLLASVGGDTREAVRRVLEAADTEDIDKLLPAPQPPGPPDPAQIAQINDIVAGTGKKLAETDKLNADAVLKSIEAQGKKHDLEMNVVSDGMKAATLGR